MSVTKLDDFFTDADVSTQEYIDGHRSTIEQPAEERKRANDNYKLYTSANTSERQKWAYECWEDYQFSKGHQLTKKERDLLEKNNAPVYVVNMVTPAIEIMKYFIIANKPMWRYAAVESSDRDAADIFRALAEYCYTKSNGQMKLAKIVNDCLTKSVGYIHIWGDANADLGRGEVMFDYQEFEDVIVDPASKDPFARDANYIIIAKNLSRTGLLNKLPQYKKEIAACSDAESVQTVYKPDYSKEGEYYEEIDQAFNPLDGELDDYIMYFEVYRKISVKMNNITMRVILKQEQVDAIKQKYSKMLKDKQQEISVLVLEKQNQLTKQIQDKENPIIQERADYELRMFNEQMAQQFQQFQEEITNKMNEELYPTRNFQVDDKQLKVMEDQFKKSKKNQSVFKDMIVDHTVYYKNKIIVSVSIGVDTFLYEKVLPFEQHIIVPLPWFWDGTQTPKSAVSMIKEKQREINKIRQIVIQHAENISNNAWISEKGVVRDKEKFSKALQTPYGVAEYVGGEDAARKPQQVQQQNIPNSFFPLLTDYKTEFEFLSGITAHLMGAVTTGDEPYRLAMARDEFSTRRLRAWVNSTFEPWLEHVGNVFNMVAKEMYTSYKVFRITQPESEENTMQYEMNIPIHDDKGFVIEKLFDYQTTKFDVTVKQGSTLPSNKDAWEERLYRLFKDSVIDDVYYLRHTELPDVNELLQRKSIYNQLQSKISGQEDEIKSLKGDIETLRRQLLQSNLKSDELELARESYKQVTDTKAQQVTLREIEKKQSELRQKQNELKELQEKKKEEKISKNKNSKNNKETNQKKDKTNIDKK